MTNLTSTANSSSLNVARWIWRYVRRSARAYIRRDFAELRTERRRLLLHLLQDDVEQITFRRDDTLWTGFVWDEGITHPLFFSGGYQSRELQALLAWLDEHGRMTFDKDFVIDAGANIGTSSIPIARATLKHVLAIEPVRENFLALEQNVRQNGLSHRITCVQAAIADERGSVAMILPSTNCGAAEFKIDGTTQGYGTVSAADRTVEVPAETLGAIIQSQDVAPERVAFVWSDTQGCERQVIDSGSALWLAGVPLYAELWPRGLKAHGGISALVDSAVAHFARFVTREEMVERGVAAEPRPISELAPLLDSLEGREFTDALFLPLT